MQLLRSYINEALALADLRNLSKDNPIPIQYAMPDGEVMIVVVSWLEPNNVTLPFNVSWIVADPESSEFGNMLRRTSADPSLGFRNTWVRLNTLQDMLAERQYWDLSNGLVLGEVDVPQVGAASPEVRGIFRLNRTYEPAQNPAVVSSSDIRMSNARNPLPHTHPKLPITMIRGASGVNDYYIQLDSINDPLPGHIFVVTAKGALPNQWVGMWRRPTASDLVYDGPMVESLEIIAPENNTIDETKPFTFKVNARFDDGSVQNDVQASWAIIGNNEYANIGAVSGNFMSLEVDEDQVVRVEATYTQPESGKVVTAYVDITVVDTTVYLKLERIEILGASELNENSESFYSVVAHFDDGSSSGVMPNTFTSSNPGAGSFDPISGRLVVPELSSDQRTTLTATFTYMGETRSATLDVDCLDITVYPVDAVIIGPSTVDENTSANYTLRVTFTDGTQQDFQEVDWSSSNEQAGSIGADGVFIAVENLRENLLTTLNASYTFEGRTVYASRSITVRDTTVYPRAAEILGSRAIREGTTTTYQLQVTFTDDTTAIVSVSTWALDNPEIGTINPTTGQLVAAADVSEDVTGTISVSYTAHGVTVTDSINITVTDETNYPISARIIGNATMSENTTQTLLFEVTYLDGSRVNQPVDNWQSSNPQAATIGSASGILTAAVNLREDATTIISASFTSEGRTVGDSLSVTVRDTTNYPVSAVINGPATIDEGKTADYTLAVTFADGTTANRSAQWTISGGAGATVNTSGRVTAPVNVDSNTAAILNASFTLDGVTVNAPPRNLQIIDTTVYPVSARIVGDAQIREGESRTYQFEVTFSDATVGLVSPTDWASSNTGVGIIGASSGSFSALEVSRTETTLITASWTQHGRTVNAELLINVLDATNYPVSATIVGPSSLDEGGTATFSLRVIYTDGTTATVAVTDWTSSRTNVGVINPTTGEFVAAANLQADSTTRLSASYTEHGVTVSGTHDVTVRDVTVYPVSAVIEGPAVIDSLAEQQYTLRVSFEDGSSLVMPATEWSQSNSEAGTINAEGLFTAAQNKTGANIATFITGKYSLDGREVTATRSIAVRDTTNYPLSIAISGPTSVFSSDENGATSHQYEATVTYVDGTTALLNPDQGQWAVRGQTESVDVGVIGSNGVFTVNPLLTGTGNSATVSFTYTEHGREVTGERKVNITVVPVPTQLTIAGPTTVNSETTQNYTATVRYHDNTTSDAFAFFTIDVPASVASIDSVGTLTTMRLEEDRAAVISATYTLNGAQVEASLNITILKAVELDRIELTGPTEHQAGSMSQYSVTAHYTDGSQADVTASANYTVAPASAGSFSAVNKGEFFAGNVAETTDATVTATFSANGRTRQATLDIQVVAPEVTGNALPRYGVAMFSDIDFTGGKTGVDVNFDIPYTRWSGVQEFADTVMTNIMPDTENREFTFNIPNAHYGYFMYPKSLTEQATFFDVALGWPGGMGGASWTPEGAVPDDLMDPNNFRGVEVMYDSGDGQGPQPWIIHRTDWDSLGEIAMRVEYNR